LLLHNISKKINFTCSIYGKCKLIRAALLKLFMTLIIRRKAIIVKRGV